jgi:hypothetical protein
LNLWLIAIYSGWHFVVTSVCARARVRVLSDIDAAHRALCDDLASNGSLGTALTFGKAKTKPSQERTISYQNLRCAIVFHADVSFHLKRAFQ